jgi:peroxiredoxin
MDRDKLLRVSSLSLLIYYLNTLNKNKKTIMAKGILTILLVLLTISLKSQNDTTTYIKTGDKAPSFICETLDGKIIDISKLQGKTILLNFFATWCPPCNRELPELQKNVWNKYMHNPDFVLIVLGREHSEREIRDFVQEKKYTMPFAPDPKREVFKLFASQSIPRNFIIGKNGKIIYQSIGYTKLEFSKMEEVLARSISK